MTEFISLLLITIIFVILDVLWFSTWSLKAIYEPTFAAIQGSPLELRLAGGIIAWFLLAVGIKYIVVPNGNLYRTFFRGALLGLVIYGVYNGTNYATFSKYPVSTAIADTLWGTFAVGTVSAIAGMI